MRNCVKQYATANIEWVEKLSKVYLDSIDTNTKNWIQGIKKGATGNILDLYMLSKITGVHCYIHLKEQNYWSTLKDPPTTHDEFMQRCNVHLVYLGNNTYIELVLRMASVSYNIFGIDQPLDLTESAPVVIGTLTSAETSTLDMLLKLEDTVSDNSEKDIIPLSNESDQTQLKTATVKTDEKHESECEHDSDSTICYEYTDYLKEKLHEEPAEVYKELNTQTQKENVPSEIVTPSQLIKSESRILTLRKRTQKLKRALTGASTTQMQNITNIGHKNIKVKKSIKKDSHLKPSKTKDISGTTSKKHKFAISSHGLLRKKRKKYNFTCPITGCKMTFHTVKDWNCHHLSSHSTVKYQCAICLKWMTTPNRFADHKYYHQDARYKCGRCNKSFCFNSGLQLHKNMHRRNKVYKCFAKNCEHSYKWPQDLLRHVKTHRKIRLCCEYCDYISKDIRLLRQHKQTHLDIKKYDCRKNCSKSFKHAMQRYRHEKGVNI